MNDQRNHQQKVVLYIHGGAWFQDPLDNHFNFIDELAGQLDAKVIMPIYPKVPHRDYRTTFELLKLIYDKQVAKVESSEQLIVMGDSAGTNCIVICRIFKSRNYTSTTGTYCNAISSVRWYVKQSRC